MRWIKNSLRGFFVVLCDLRVSKRGAEFRSTIQALISAANPGQDTSPPDIVWEGDRHDIEIGGMTIEHHYLGLNHGLGMTVFVVPELRVAYISDLVTPNRVGFNIMPDFNIGTDMGATCAAQIETATTAICSRAAGYSSTVNGRFKGGWTTRHYGQPDDHIHAVQMELAQSTYLTNEAAPWTYDQAKADHLRPHLTSILTALAALAPSLGVSK